MNLPTEFLTPNKFEKFSNRVAEVLFDKNIIGFGEGKDDGIDGVDDIMNPTIIIQSKRFHSRTNPSSLVKLAEKEIDKIRGTSKKFGWNSKFEYVLITSAELNPISRKKIRDYAGDLMSTDQNVIDGTFLKDLSSKEKFEKIFSDFDLKDKKLVELIKEDKRKSIELESKDYYSDFSPKYFVETEVLYKLYDILNNERLAILTGEPGVGKTTACKMMGNLFSCKNDGEYFILERNIDEIQNVIEMFNQYYREDVSKKLFVVFDDFLGRTSLDTSEKQIKKLRNLYSLVNNCENLYVLLNSRTQIFNAARNEDIEFGQLIDDQHNKRLSIDISKYTKVEKARIFRNNIELVFERQSSLDKEVMNNKYSELIEGKKYRDIVFHRNFNPRLIVLIASQSLKSTGSYYDYCVKSLNDPSEIYEGLFKKLPEMHKLFLICLFCFEDYPVKLVDMEDAFREIVINDSYDLNETEKNLEESWVVIKNDETFINERIDFANPSIIDFISNKKDTNSLFLKVNRQTRYLSQVIKSADLIDLYDKIANNYDRYFDKEMYIGEKISIILDGEKTFETELFIELLYKFNGKYHSKHFPSNMTHNSFRFYMKRDWSDLISEFHDSKNISAKKIFLDELLYSENNSILLEKILYNCSDLDALAASLSFLIEDIYGISLEKNIFFSLAEDKSGINLYDEIMDFKEEEMQEMADDHFELDILSDLEELIDSEDDKEWVKDLILEEHKENIFHKLKNTFFENKKCSIDLNFSEIEEYIDEQIDDYLTDINKDSDKNEYHYVPDTETIDSILNRPLN